MPRCASKSPIYAVGKMKHFDHDSARTCYPNQLKNEKTRKNNQTTCQSSVPKTTCSLCRETNPLDFRKNNKIVTITKKQWHTYGPWNSSGWHRCGHRFDVSDLSIIHREAMTKPLMIRWIFMTDLSWFFHSHSFQAKMVDNQHIRDVGHIEKLISFVKASWYLHEKKQSKKQHGNISWAF